MVAGTTLGEGEQRTSMVKGSCWAFKGQGMAILESENVPVERTPFTRLTRLSSLAVGAATLLSMRVLAPAPWRCPPGLAISWLGKEAEDTPETGWPPILQPIKQLNHV